MKYFALIIPVIFSFFPGLSASETDTAKFTVFFYNVENLFDTRDDPSVADEEFTPKGDKQWTQERYLKKLEDIGRVIASTGDEELPAIVGLCEVENRGVLNDLVEKSALKAGGFGIVHHDSPDIRGIDVALLYRKDFLTIRSEKSVRINLPNDSITTRDILYVSGTTPEGDLLHFFVNHWSSRSEGEKVTERRRLFAAVMLRKAVDSILNYEPLARIIVMGDFNDEPTNTSLHNIFNANNKRKNASPREFYNLFYDLHNEKNLGTYSYKGNWNMLDQILVSQALLRPEKGYGVDYGDGRILKEDWMLTDPADTGEKIPNRSFGGPEYYGGVSDHLPVFAVFKRR